MAADGQHADAIALFFSLIGGFFMGAYPVPIKAPQVLQVEPHAVVFQCYKTFWVFLSGWLFVLANIARGEARPFVPTWWGVVSAAGWIPSGLCTIVAVPRLGIGMAIAVSTGTASVLSFLVFWLVLGESMKEHMIAGHRVYLAPIYLVCVVAGMVVLVVAPRFGGEEERRGETDLTADGIQAATGGITVSERPLVSMQTGRATSEAQNFIFGTVLAILAGVFSAVQFGTVNLGKKAAQYADGCQGDVSNCSAAFKEQFNNFGSWNASFGVGASGLYVAGFFAIAKAKGKPLP